jgi:hypothetical protein
LVLRTGEVNANVSASGGGGLNIQPGGTANITQSTFRDNRSGTAGGGIANLGRATLTRTLIERNQAANGRWPRREPHPDDPDQLGHPQQHPGQLRPPNTIPGCVN